MKIAAILILSTICYIWGFKHYIDSYGFLAFCIRTLCVAGVILNVLLLFLYILYLFGVL